MKRSEKSVKNRKDDTNHKGFTLVELIVVIVILAILAAILIPGLLKWMDKAKEKQYELEARNIYLATEASLVELHGLGFDDTNAGVPWDLTTINDDYITYKPGNIHNNQLAGNIKEMSGIDNITYLRMYIDRGKLKALAIEYESADTKTIRATIKEKGSNPSKKDLDGIWEWSEDGTWNIEVMD